MAISCLFKLKMKQWFLFILSLNKRDIDIFLFPKFSTKEEKAQNKKMPISHLIGLEMKKQIAKLRQSCDSFCVYNLRDNYPHQCISMGSTTPMAQLMRILLHCLISHICLCEIHSNISNISSFEQRSGPSDPITKTVESYHQDLLRLGHCQA